MPPQRYRSHVTERKRQRPLATKWIRFSEAGRSCSAHADGEIERLKHLAEIDIEAGSAITLDNANFRTADPNVHDAAEALRHSGTEGGIAFMKRTLCVEPTGRGYIP